MKIVKTTCTPKTSVACHNTLIASNPGLISVKHCNNNHILLFANDYDANGHHDIQIHKLSQSLDSGDGIDAAVIAAKLNVSLNPVIGVV